MRLQLERRIEAANHLIRKREPECNELLQQLNQPDIYSRDQKFTVENSQMIPITPKRVLPQQVARSEFSIPTQIIFNVIAERQKSAFITDTIISIETFLYN